MTISWRAATAALDAGTAVFATINAAYFIARLAGSRDEAYGRRVAAAVLVVVSLGALAEALVLLASTATSDPAPLLSSSQWASVRFMACAGSGGICALVLRRLTDGQAKGDD